VSETSDTAKRHTTPATREQFRKKQRKNKEKREKERS
jgi:hypothetical protein